MGRPFSIAKHIKDKSSVIPIYMDRPLILLVNQYAFENGISFGLAVRRCIRVALCGEKLEDMEKETNG
ncbi:hypothetical protein IQ272_14935 [Chroococcidiopsidales cyanobacterium LEGE 13417]|nr:hypothetical protein [Chroococcidiopsidales cyanobacterium LEGE 13417]